MPEPDWPARIAGVVAGFGLSTGEIAGPRVSDDAWPAVRGRIVEQRLTGLAVAAAHAGCIELSEEQAAELRSRHREAMVWALTLERELLKLDRDMRDAGIEPVVLKGPALAHTFYPDPAWRAFGDLDVLVGSRDWVRACGVLAERGFRRRLPEPRPGFDRRFGKAATHVDDHGVQVDLHVRLTLGAVGLLVDPDVVARRNARFALGGRELRRLDDTSALLHACLHASLGSSSPRLLPLRDVVQVARCATVDWSLLEAWGRQWRLRAVLRHAFSTATELLHVELPAAARAAVSHQPSARERRVLSAYVGGRRERGGTALSVIGALPGVRAKAAYVGALLLPDREFLAARAEGRRPSYLRRWSTALGWTKRRHG